MCLMFDSTCVLKCDVLLLKKCVSNSTRFDMDVKLHFQLSASTFACVGEVV